jgi:hypothetical protein
VLALSCSYLRVLHLLADRDSEEGQLEEVDLVGEAGDEVLVERDDEAAAQEGLLLDELLQLERQLMPQLALVELAQLRQLGRDLGALRLRLLHELQVLVHHLDCSRGGAVQDDPRNRNASFGRRVPH